MTHQEGPRVSTGLKRIPTRWGHRYELDGRDCPGVTTLIKHGIPNPKLMHWAARAVAQHVYDLGDDELLSKKHQPQQQTVSAWKSVPFKKAKEAAARGTDVHTFAEKLIKGLGVQVPEHLAGYVQSAVDFMQTWRPAPIAIEAVVGNREHHYCGTVDLIADLPDGRRALMDYKTSRTGIYPEAALQLAAYRNAEFMGENGDETRLSTLGINCAYAVWLRPDGYDVIPLDTSPEVFNAFLSAAAVATFADTMTKWVGKPEAWSAV